ncbi:MAG: 1-acyl-sn-glycerol-3-phosphate acyltransferase [Actinobacteria bacterium]|nr:1-acyl-sn-glycerol-3-phosphate acyltransferase [Actinomycetota bacterium]MCB9412624.1 1-acyl-sn-glycerol-3-phosphate acyltransferase [Actinomycetota bacterium]
MPGSAAYDPQHRPLPPDEVVKTPVFVELIDSITAETERPRDKVAEEVRDCLGEMAVVPSATQTSQLVWKRLSKFMSRAYRVDVDDHGLKHLRKLGKEASLIFLPNHKSYLDPVILRSTLAKHGFPPNYVLGGDNLAFWPMAPLARRNGIVFIRREFKDADVYKRTLRTYLGFLLSNKANLEWYIEGGRSRTGKLRPPRYGILSYVVDAFNTIEDEAAYCVPVSVTYDQQHEIGAISAEEMGASKSPESVKWLYQYAKDQSRALGRVHLRFGEPLSIGEAIETVRRDELAKAEELGVEPPTNLDRYAVPKIAFEVSHRINKVTPITPTSLVTFALLDNDDRALTLGQSQSVLNPLLEYIALRGLPLTSDVEIGETNGLLRSMDTLISEGVVNRYDGGTEPVYSINPDRVHEAGFYRNSIAHHFLTRAMVEVATLQVVKSGEDIVDGLWPAVKALEDLLKYEFFFPSSRKLADSVARETELVAPNWQNREWNAVTALDELRETPMHVAHRTIGPFLEAYEIVAIRLAERLPSRPIEPKDFIAECIGFAKMRWLQRSLHSPESISKNLFDGALKLAGNRDLISPGGEDLRLRRQAFADELRNAVALVQEIRRMANAQEGLTQEVSA